MSFAELQEGDLSFLKYDYTEEGLNAVDPGPDYVSWRWVTLARFHTSTYQVKPQTNLPYYSLL
jgi:hypothetical protein